MMRRIIALLTGLALWLALPVPVSALETRPENHLTLGTSTEMSGFFGTDLWSNNATDLDIRTLLSDYDTVAFIKDQGLGFNPTVVRTHEVATLDNGNEVFEVEIQEGLTYCDGTPITARDYVFSIMLGISPEVMEIGGSIQRLDHVAGFEAYHTGAAEALEGLRLLSDQAFSMEIRADYLPYFYGLELLSAKPLPISVIAPGCEVRDDGAGAYIAAAEDAGLLESSGLSYTPGVFSAGMLRETLLNPDSGYVFRPAVTSGAYVLDDVDLSSQRAEFSRNPHYAGNYEGQKPAIERLSLRVVESGEMYEALADGRIDLAHRIFHGSEVKKFTDNASVADFQVCAYPRSGAAYLAFACEQPLVSDASLRRVMALALDRGRLIEDEMDGIAVPVHGYYGTGQWISSFVEMGELHETDEDAFTEQEDRQLEELIAIPRVLETLEVPFDLEEAARLLEESGWSYDGQGRDFTAGGGALRHRKSAEGTLESLSLRLAVTEGNEIAADIQKLYAETLPSLGIGLEVVEMPFLQLLRHYTRQTDRLYDLFFVATDFGQVYDPYYDFHTDEEYQGLYNTTGLRDEKMMLLAQSVANTNPMDLHAYALKWIDFQQYFVEQMPMIPLYSSNYYDYFRPELQGYDPAKHLSWAAAILYASFK